MSLDDSTPEPGAAPAGRPVRVAVHYSASVARAICRRVTAGETLLAICRDADMPSRGSVNAWVRQDPKFAAMYHRAKVFGNRTGRGRPASYCAATAHEIAVRVSEGEPMSDIARDPAMPALRTIFYWETTQPEFAEAIELARWAQAERLSDLGWKMALAATPQTTFLTRMQLGHLRWAAGVKSPRTHGRLKAADPPEAPAPPNVLAFRHFHLEMHPQTGQHRVVRYTPDPDTMLPVRDHEGPWTDPVDPVAKMAEIQRLSAERRAREARPNPPDDPEG